MKNKILMLIMISVFIFGCSEDSYVSPESKSSNYFGYYKICLDGHLYWQSLGSSSSGLAGILDDNGKPIKCEEK